VARLGQGGRAARERTRPSQLKRSQSAAKMLLVAGNIDSVPTEGAENKKPICTLCTYDERTGEKIAEWTVHMHAKPHITCIQLFTRTFLRQLSTYSSRQTSPDFSCPCQGHTGAVESLCLSPNGQYVVSGGADKFVRVWDPGTGKQKVCCVLCAPARLGALHVCLRRRRSRRAKREAGSGCALIPGRTRGQIPPFKGHTGAIHAVTFSLDGRLIASGRSVLP
jgi:WD40 repeat protein